MHRPGCTSSACGELGEKNEWILDADGKSSISNAVISNIFITGKNSPDDTSPCEWGNWGSDDCYSAPQSALFIPWSGNGAGCTSGVTMKGVTMLKSWADSFNIHGCANDIHIEGNTLWYALQCLNQIVAACLN